MDKDSAAVMLSVILIVSAFLLIAFKIADLIKRFRRDTEYILSEMNRAESDVGYRYWRRELRCHYLCLIPFVTERNVMRLYHRLYHRPAKEKKEKRSDGFGHIIAPSVIGACICAVCRQLGMVFGFRLYGNRYNAFRSFCDRERADCSRRRRIHCAHHR